MEALKQVLIASIQKNGNQVLTLQHLVNMINYAQKCEDRRISRIENELDEAYMEICADQCGDRD